jgi:hypothetical protein
VSAPSAPQWGPDGKLQVASRFGRVGVYEVEKTTGGA